MMQIMVVKVHLKCRKCRSKVMTIAAMTSGVVSVKIEGEEKNIEVVVIGEGVDAAKMTSLMRKKVGHASLDFVADLEED